MSVTKKRPRYRDYKPYAYMMAILYGNFSWIERNRGGVITLPVRGMCSHFKCNPTQLRHGLELLLAIGVIEQFNWKSTWVTLRAAIPLGMIREESYIEKSIINIKEDSGTL